MRGSAPAALLLAPHVEERLGEDVSRLVEASLDLAAALPVAL